MLVCLCFFLKPDCCRRYNSRYVRKEREIQTTKLTSFPKYPNQFFSFFGSLRIPSTPSSWIRNHHRQVFNSQSYICWSFRTASAVNLTISISVPATIDGLIDHTDSLGNGGRYGQGDVQWMTAGKGIVHGEMFPLIHKEKPNHTRFFQIWINLPSKSKMVEPSFAMFWNNQVPKWKSEDGKAAVTVFYGERLIAVMLLLFLVLF
jgi:Pirin